MVLPAKAPLPAEVQRRPARGFVAAISIGLGLLAPNRLGPILKFPLQASRVDVQPISMQFSSGTCPLFYPMGREDSEVRLVCCSGLAFSDRIPRKVAHLHERSKTAPFAGAMCSHSPAPRSSLSERSSAMVGGKLTSRPFPALAGQEALCMLAPAWIAHLGTRHMPTPPGRSPRSATGAQTAARWEYFCHPSILMYDSPKIMNRSGECLWN